MEVDSGMTKEVGRKREIHDGSDMAGERRTSRKISEYSSGLDDQMDASDDEFDALFDEAVEIQVKRLVAEWNAENPDAATPLVAEALTEQQRASLLQEDLAREIVRGKEYRARMMEEDMARVEEERDPNQDDDDREYQEYREHWEWKTIKQFGSFEDRTRIPAMCYTDKPMGHPIIMLSTMQIFSVKVEKIDAILKWPLDVFGIVAVRDDLDYNRNIIFERKRDDCQTLNEQDPYLVLTGPARAPVFACGPIHVDVILKVKYTNESEDKDLSLIATRYTCCPSFDFQAGNCAHTSCASSEKFKSKLSTLEMTCSMVVSSIEATISVCIDEGSWPAGFSGQFSAFTANMSQMKVSLLKFGDGNVPVSTADDTIILSRRVVSVESFGELRIRAAAWRGNNKIEREVRFEPLKSGRSYHDLTVGSCKMVVTVGWSLVSIAYPTSRISSSNGEASQVG